MKYLNCLSKLTVLIFAICSVSSSLASNIFSSNSDADLPTAINIVNPSFESDKKGWTTSVNGWKQSVLSDELAAAPDGTSYLRIVGKGTVQQSLSEVTIQAGRTYVVTVWARSVNPPSTNNSVETRARIELKAGNSASIVKKQYQSKHR